MMAYRIPITVAVEIDSSAIDRIQQLRAKSAEIAEPILRDTLGLVKQYAVQNLSGMPFTSETGTHIINKRTGKGAASVQVQYPYSSPYNARLFASALTQYPGNPESWNYLKILEEGRGEVKPRYTPSMRAGNPGQARLAIPGGPHNLVFGVSGFRGATGQYRFTKSLPPMEGRYWMRSAVEQARPEFENIANQHLDSLFNS